MNTENIIAKRPSKVIYREGDKVVKLFDEHYSKANVLNEALNQARIEETGLKIPKLHEVKKIDGKWAIVLDYIEGKTLEELMKAHPEKKNEYIERLVDIQVEILSHKVAHLNKIKEKIDN